MCIRDRIKNKKVETTVEMLCKGYPEELKEYMNYCRRLTFVEKPDYEYLKGLFGKVIEREGYKDDGIYDWIIAVSYTHLRAHETSLHLVCRLLLEKKKKKKTKKKKQTKKK
eukprot:TRINITY_DN5493_c0_g1_i5.p1 TRINITY_DN5493_c0_g1~~TRINITY_DN5493_c0_g1_i5.p1  ORF type:complete len:126 (+),score=42.89 TRINITY_DN5493_c0_g1_i5:48-380(+)